ncbi:hypothetical protein MPH_01721 [Macrophomina phaseolina MS6]|uniref:Uncharacterized protein n=1 Tax=Macrophomina phaseolina (strain MS6) TaxID=1126212 RepID=K2SEV9_MACPH|nr:hypothetical protein MPH_01721 [Macrophomina phaseolina MS6]
MSLDTDILIIGGGPSGLGMAIQLIRKFGIRNFTIVEKTDDIGGTWSHPTSTHFPSHSTPTGPRPSPCNRKYGPTSPRSPNNMTSADTPASTPPLTALSGTPTRAPGSSLSAKPTPSTSKKALLRQPQPYAARFSSQPSVLSPYPTHAPSPAPTPSAARSSTQRVGTTHLTGPTKTSL